MSFETIEIKMAAVSAKRSIADYSDNRLWCVVYVQRVIDGRRGLREARYAPSAPPSSFDGTPLFIRRLLLVSALVSQCC